MSTLDRREPHDQLQQQRAHSTRPAHGVALHRGGIAAADDRRHADQRDQTPQVGEQVENEDEHEAHGGHAHAAAPKVLVSLPLGLKRSLTVAHRLARRVADGIERAGHARPLEHRSDEAHALRIRTQRRWLGAGLG